MKPKEIARRWFLQQCGVGLGAVALTSLLGETGLAAPDTGPADPLAPKKPPLVPKAKRVIFLFMAGAPSHLELFDYKPQLAKFDGTLPPPDLLKGYRAAFINPNSKLLGPKFKFAKYGQSGAELSELLPHLAKAADNIAIVKSMVTDAFNHAPGQLLMNTGTMQFGRPSMGAWVTYGLGSESKDLPAFVVFSSGKKGPSGGNSCWGSGFLPTVYQGVQFRSSGDPVLYLSNPPGVDEALQRDTLNSIKSLNQVRLNVTGDPEIATRINSFEMAFRMQSSAPELMDVSQEPKPILEMYGAEPGKPSFANNCLLARRLVERGVRFVQLYHEA
ncbi:MAG: sulfatase, partial [Acidobacteria bacterium]